MQSKVKILTQQRKMDKKISTIKQRCLELIEKKGITQSVFFQQVGLSPSNFKGVNLQSELGGDKIVSILTVYGDVSPDWFLLGYGDMFRKEHIGHVQNGKQNKIDRSPINVGCSDIEQLKKENEMLRERLKDKEDIINLLKSKK